MKLTKKFSDLLNYDFNSIVFNFVDMLSHARSENKLFKNLVYDEKSFRSLSLSWLKNSPLSELFKFLSKKDVIVFLTTDHGTIRVEKPIKIMGN
ncbi:MAG: PglZ domain-containing protein, partial [SAR324 cluster bacterium]|nr:PglZ domain-containing protein [SAR324 cluster bacterium]